MEGELRYYGNHGRPSTLTIKLYEKDIRTAASSPRANACRPASRSRTWRRPISEALKAIADAKGRVTALGAEAARRRASSTPSCTSRSAPRRPARCATGSSSSAPWSACKIDRVQQTEDGGPAPKDGKIERGKTQFFVSIYNLANVAPRETVILRLAAADVPAVYRSCAASSPRPRGT